jgi:hypothetical protein
MTRITEPLPGPSITARQRGTLIVSCLAVALVVASMAALYAALPDIAVATGATQEQQTWVVDGFRCWPVIRAGSSPRGSSPGSVRRW